MIGTDNVLTAAIEAGVECVICLSTDKAAYPINAMGITKAIDRKGCDRKIPQFRQNQNLLYPLRQCDVLPRLGHSSVGSTRSGQGNPITITDPAMTRFIMILGGGGGPGSLCL